MIRVPAGLRDRLRQYGIKGQTYAEIIENLMNQVDSKRFVRKQQKLLAEAIEERDRLTNLRDL